MDSSDNKITIQKLQKGDKHTFDRVYWTLRKPMYGLAYRYLKDAQLAEDAVQDVFLKLWLSRKELDEKKSLEGFLFTMLKNNVLNMIKSHKRRILRQFDYAENHKKKSETPEDVIFFTDTNEILNEALEQLPESKKLIFKLKRFYGFSNKEIASQLDISIHTVKSQFYRASRFLKKFILARTE